MQISTDAIIPITDAAKSFKSACDKTREHGTTFIFKNNRPDIVMMDISRYRQIMSVLELIEHMEIAEMVSVRKALDNGKRFGLDEVLCRVV